MKCLTSKMATHNCNSRLERPSMLLKRGQSRVGELFVFSGGGGGGEAVFIYLKPRLLLLPPPSASCVNGDERNLAPMKKAQLCVHNLFSGQGEKMM